MIGRVLMQGVLVSPTWSYINIRNSRVPSAWFDNKAILQHSCLSIHVKFKALLNWSATDLNWGHEPKQIHKHLIVGRLLVNEQLVTQESQSNPQFTVVLSFIKIEVYYFLFIF